MRKAGALALALATVAVAGCHRPKPPPPVVAWIGKTPVYAAELQVELERAKKELVPHRDPAEAMVQPAASDLAVLRRTVLGELIDRRLLLAKAKAAGVQVTDREVHDALAARAGDKAPDPTQVRLTRDELVIDRFLLREVAARVGVTPDEERAYYEAHADEFTRPEQVRCSQILAPTREAAQALKVRLTRGEPFDKVAREASTAIDKDKGGDLGWFAHGEMPPEIDQACFALKKGQVSDVVKSPYGYHLFKLTDHRAAAPMPFAQAEERINLTLSREKVAKAEHDYLEKLRRQAGVSVVEAELAKVP